MRKVSTLNIFVKTPSPLALDCSANQSLLIITYDRIELTIVYREMSKYANGCRRAEAHYIIEERRINCGRFFYLHVRIAIELNQPYSAFVCS
ncbi:hypothetical protein ACFWDG_06025 [Peribacillus sp. NPDC060186]